MIVKITNNVATMMKLKIIDLWFINHSLNIKTQLGKLHFSAFFLNIIEVPSLYSRQSKLSSLFQFFFLNYQDTFKIIHVISSSPSPMLFNSSIFTYRHSTYIKNCEMTRKKKSFY